MASVVHAKLKKIKNTGKNVAEKYREALEKTLHELSTPAQLKEGLEAFVNVGKAKAVSSPAVETLH